MFFCVRGILEKNMNMGNLVSFFGRFNFVWTGNQLIVVSVFVGYKLPQLDLHHWFSLLCLQPKPSAAQSGGVCFEMSGCSGSL